MAEPKIRRALLSVSDKTGLISFATALSERGVEIVSTGGTAAALKTAGVAVAKTIPAKVDVHRALVRRS